MTWFPVQVSTKRKTHFLKLFEMNEGASFQELLADLPSDIVGTSWLLCSSLMLARGQGHLDLRKLIKTLEPAASWAKGNVAK